MWSGRPRPLPLTFISYFPTTIPNRTYKYILKPKEAAGAAISCAFSVMRNITDNQTNPTTEKSNREDSAPKPPVIEIHAVAEPTRKRRGEAAEAAFLARATQIG